MFTYRKLISSIPFAKAVYRAVHPIPDDPATESARKFISERQDGFFVQIGSNDGVTGDPIHQHVIANDWSGIVVEPLPDLFSRLEETYRGVTKVRAVRAAIASTTGVMTIYRVSGSLKGDPPWADQLASFDPKVILKHVGAVPNLAKRITPVEVPTLTWFDLLAIIGPRDIDLLHVDAEGHDYEILRCVDWSAPTAPKACLYEHKHLSSSDAETSKDMFESKGYSLTVGQVDTYCQR